MTLGVLVDWLAAALLAFTIFFYVVVYTMWLKRSTPQNIVIGGAAGALPPVIGWAAATGAVSLESVILFLIIFLWTPPHFWALALFKSGDYARAGIPMMPNVAGRCLDPAPDLRSMRCWSRRSACCPGCSASPAWATAWSRRRSAPASSGTPGSVLQDAAGDAGMRPAKALFAFSILYLFGIFAALSRRPAVGALVDPGGSMSDVR